MSVLALLKKAVVCHNAGDLQKADRMYRQVSDHPDATHFMGVLGCNAGKNDLAIVYLKKAIELMRSNAGCFNNMGNVSQRQEKRFRRKSLIRLLIRHFAVFGKTGCQMVMGLKPALSGPVTPCACSGCG